LGGRREWRGRLRVSFLAESQARGGRSADA